MNLGGAKGVEGFDDAGGVADDSLIFEPFGEDALGAIGLDMIKAQFGVAEPEKNLRR
jgi:hypothetical protein